jgi:beta-carotene 15,15'-dioxygenase
MLRVNSRECSSAVALEQLNPKLRVAADVCHRWIVIAIFGGVLVAHGLGWHLALVKWPALAAVLILALGVPHGALDVPVLRFRGQMTTFRDATAVLAAYIALAIFTAALWYVLPALSLSLFLVTAAYHFGGDFRIPHKGWRFVLGGALLTATTFFHTPDVTTIFGWMTGPTSSPRIALAMGLSALPCLLAAAGFVLYRTRDDVVEALEIALVLTAAVCLDPITFFILYFCLLHSVRHVLGVHDELRGRGTHDLIVEALPYAALAITATVILGWLAARGDIGESLLAVVFIALAALTVPHMLLVADKPIK